MVGPPGVAVGVAVPGGTLIGVGVRVVVAVAVGGVLLIATHNAAAASVGMAALAVAPVCGQEPSVIQPPTGSASPANAKTDL
jgi:hypothetical protein